MKIIANLDDHVDHLEQLQAVQKALLAGLHSVAETERIRDLAFVMGHEDKLREIGCLPVLSTTEDRTGAQIVGAALHYVNDMVFDFAFSLAEELRRERKPKEQNDAAA